MIVSFQKPADGHLRLYACVAAWLARRKPRVAPSTYHALERALYSMREDRRLWHKRIDRVASIDLARWRRSMRGPGSRALSPATKNARLKIVQSLFADMASLHGFRDPAAVLQPLREPQRPRTRRGWRKPDNDNAEPRWMDSLPQLA